MPMNLKQALHDATRVAYRYCPSCAKPFDPGQARLYVPISGDPSVRVCRACREKWQPEDGE